MRTKYKYTAQKASLFGVILVCIQSEWNTIRNLAYFSSYLQPKTCYNVGQDHLKKPL